MASRMRCSGSSAAIFLAVIASFLMMRGAAAEPNAGAAAAPGPALDPGTGTLYLKLPDGLVPAPALRIDADLHVNGLVAQGTVRQTFRNTSGTTIEALYVFPLPERASLDGFEMRIGDRIVRSVVREREQARADYDAARREGKQAALVEFARKGLFRTSIAGIPPNGEIAVTLRYFDQVEYRDGRFALSLPLTWTPRYRVDETPSDAHVGSGSAAAPSDRCDVEAFVPGGSGADPEVTVRVALDAGAPVAEVRSGSHPIRVDRDGADGTIRIATRPGAPADRDFLLEWSLESAARPRGAIFLEDREEGPCGLLMLLPPDDDRAADEGLSTGTLFVVDVSGSMEGPSLAQAKTALLAALDALKPGDTFNLLKFSSTSSPFRADFQPATPSRLDEARAWVRDLHTEGGTEILAALRHAQALLETAPGRGTRRVILVTDGAVDAGDDAITAIARGFGEARLHVVGIGLAPNRSLLRLLARRGRGAAEFIGSPDEVGPRLGAFLERLRRPVMTDLVLDWDGPVPVDVRPGLLPDLHAGEPLLLSFRAAPGAIATGVTLRGVTASGPFSTRIEIHGGAPRGTGPGVLWARAFIADRIDGLAAGVDEEKVRAEVLPLALEFGLVTAYTSRVAIEERVSYRDAATVAAASVLPGSAGEEVALPQGGTRDRLWLRCGLVALVVGWLLGLVRRVLA